MKQKKNSPRLRSFLVFGLILLFNASAFAQEVVMLEVDTEDGSNGAGVAWNPEKRLYYAVFAGNASFPLVVFNNKGNKLDEFEAGYDVRGFWYNEKTQQLGGNGYGESGWYALTLDNKGMPDEAEALLEGMYQPEEQAVGVLNPLKQTVIFFSEGTLYTYKSSGKSSKSIDLDLSSSDLEELNYTSPIFTGVKGQEIGLLQPAEHRVLFFSLKTGEQTGSLKLPSDSPEPSAFNFSYANGRIWLFNTEERIWYGYKADF